MYTLRHLFCEFSNIFDRIVPQGTFLGWKRNFKCDDCWNGKESHGQQTLLAKKQWRNCFWSVCIPNFKKEITIIFIRQSLRRLHGKRNLHFSSLTIHANIFLTCFLCMTVSDFASIAIFFSQGKQHHFQAQHWLQKLLMNKKFRLSTLIPAAFVSSEDV